MSSYVEDHPGGDSILKNVGGNASQGAHGPQHPASMWDVLGELPFSTRARFAIYIFPPPH